MPVIAITRGTLAGAGLLAETVAAELGIPCISREVIVEAAREAGISEEFLVEQMDRPPSIFNRYSRERDAYLWHIRSVLCQHALKGSFVYHGHGGNMLLADLSNLIRVRVVASMPYRVAAVMESHGINSEDAAKHIRKMDSFRKKWVHYLYDIDWQDPSCFDLILNIETLDVGDACTLLTHCARLDRFAWTEEAKQNVADVALAARVTAVLARGGELYSGKLELSAKDNVLTIAGRVRSRQALQEVRAAAEKAIDNTELRFDVTVASEDFSWGFEHMEE